MKNFLLLTTLLLAFVLTKAQENSALQIMDGQSYFWCPTFDSYVTADVTFEAWVKLDAEEIVDDYTAVVDGRYGPKNFSKALIFKTNTAEMLTLSFEWEGAWSFLDEDGLNEVQKDEWQHVALVVNGTEGSATFYVNGVEGVVYTPDGPTAAEYGNIGEEIYWDTLFVAGGNTDPARTVIGLIDEIRVWYVARTESEIVDNMTHEIDPETDGLLAYYRCNESPGDTILTDIAGWENHAVVRSGNDTTYTFVPLTDEDWAIPVSAVEGNKLESVSVYPNPVKDILKFRGLDVTNSVVKIFNITGQLVEKSIVHNSAFNVSNLNSGIYIVEINKDNQKFFTKIIKE